MGSKMGIWSKSILGCSVRCVLVVNEANDAHCSDTPCDGCQAPPWAMLCDVYMLFPGCSPWCDT